MTERTPPIAAERLSRSVFTLSIAGALVFLYLRTFLLPAVPFVAHDDQILFFIRGARVAHGQILYRDFFELVPPGIDSLYGATFRLFGIHAWIMQAWCIALGLALFSVVTLIARRILRGPLVLFPGLLFLIFDFNSALDPTHHWFSTLAALMAVGVLMGGASLRRIFASSSFCAIATLFTQTQGALTFVALLLYLLWLKRSEAQGPGLRPQLATLVLPFTLILSCVVGYYVHKAGFRTIFFDLVLFPLKFLSSGNFNSPHAYLDQLLPLHAPGGVVRLIPVVFIYAVVPYIYAVGAYQLWRKREILPARLRQHLVLLHLVGVALFLAVASGPRFHRLCTVAPPAILVCAWLLSQPGPALRLARNLSCLLAIAFAFLLPFYRQTQWHATLDLPIGTTAFSDPLEFREYQWLAERSHPSELLFNHGGLDLYLSLENPTASEFVTDTDFTRPEQVAAVLESLQRRPPRFIVLEPENTNPSDVHDHSAPFRQYVYDNYHLIQVFPLNHNSRYEELWERLPPR